MNDIEALEDKVRSLEADLGRANDAIEILISIVLLNQITLAVQPQVVEHLLATRDDPNWH